MTTTDTSTDADAPAAAESADDPAGSFLGIADVVGSTDHKTIGRLYVVTGVLALLATVVVSVIMQIERSDGNSVLTDRNAWAQLFDAQRIGLVFGSLIPITLGLALAVVPLQLGARALAFPRMAMAGFWTWAFGLVLTIIALANDGGSAGLTGDMVDLYYASWGLMAAGVLATAACLATSVLTTRTPGMTMRRVPFFSWSVLVYALAIVLVMPVLVGTLVYLFVDHRYGSREAFGGNTGALAWASWILTQPATFLFAIPAIGVFADLLPGVTGRRTPARGVMYSGIALVGVAAFAGVTQQNIQGLPWAGSGVDLEGLDEKFEDLVPYSFFNVLPLLGAVIVLLFGLYISRPGKGARPNVSGSLAVAFFGFLMVVTAMLGNLLYAVDDLGLQGTIFDEGTLVLVAYGAIIAVVGGIGHWIPPKMIGTRSSSGILAGLGLVGAAGAVLVALPLWVAGFLDQPSGFVYDDSDLQIWNIVALVGHAVFGLFVLGAVVVMIRTLRSGSDDAEGRDADAIVDGLTVEWLAASPVPADNYDEMILVESAEPVLDRELEGSDA